MSEQSFSLDSVADATLAAENAVLRAALADAQQRIHELEQRADSDSLTGLANGRRFAREVERVAGEAQRHGTPAAIVSIDLRGFSALNARHGSLAGDAALVHVARLLSGLIRATDVLARTGGDEFGLVLSHFDQNSAIETADRLARCIAAEKVPFGNERIALRASVATTGILPGDSPADVLTRAARNLAVAKADG
jgi:diguanylate cyclase (GGDEF)-like protein